MFLRLFVFNYNYNITYATTTLKIKEPDGGHLHFFNGSDIIYAPLD